MRIVKNASRATIPRTQLNYRMASSMDGEAPGLLMKTRQRVLAILIGLCGTVALTSAFGQTTYIWTGAADGTNLAAAGNWTPNGIPRPDVTDGTAYGDEMQFDGQMTGPLAVTQNGGIQVLGGGSMQPYGLRIHVTSNQTSSVAIQSSVAISAGMRMNYFAIDAGSGGMILGGHNGNAYNIIAGVLDGQILGFTNNSSTPSEITEGLRWTLGGAGPHPFVFTGTGDWIVNNHMRTFNGNPVLIQKFGSGTMTWAGTNNANSAYVEPIGNPITIGGGTMVWKTSDLVGGSAGNPDIVNNGRLKYDATSGSCIVAGAISGTGLLQVSSGTLTLSGANTYTGGTLISNGTLALIGSGSISSSPTIHVSAGATLDVSGAGGLTLAPGQTLEGHGTVNGDLDVISGATIVPGFPIEAPAINGNLSIDSGTIVANINTSFSPSNSFYQVTGSINSTAGTLKLLNFGPSLTGNDKFNIFNQAVSGGGSIVIVSPGFIVNNNLAADGSVTVAGVQPPGSNLITPSVSGGQLTLSWPSAWMGLHLQVQTNSLGTNWITIPGTDASNSYLTALENSVTSVFYRLAP